MKGAGECVCSAFSTGLNILLGSRVGFAGEPFQHISGNHGRSNE